MSGHKERHQPADVKADNFSCCLCAQEAPHKARHPKRHETWETWCSIGYEKGGQLVAQGSLPLRQWSVSASPVCIHPTWMLLSPWSSQAPGWALWALWLHPSGLSGSWLSKRNSTYIGRGLIVQHLHVRNPKRPKTVLIVNRCQ